jgi:hypothetical protein
MIEVKEVKVAMSFASVEEARGLPNTRVDLGANAISLVVLVADAAPSHSSGDRPPRKEQ